MSKEHLINISSKIQKNSEIIFTEMDDEVVMMSIENGKYYGIDPIGGRIWEFIQMPQKVSDICGKLQEEYNVTQEQCAVDVLRFLNKLSDNDIITVVEE